MIEQLVNNLGDFKRNKISSDLLLLGARSDLSNPHNITAGEAGSWFYDVPCIAAPAGRELMSEWSTSNGLILKPDLDVMPKEIQRGYCLFIWHAFIISSANTGTRYARPFFLNRANNSILYQNLTAVSDNTPSSRLNLSGSCITPIIWDDNGLCTPALGFNLIEGDQINSAALTCLFVTNA